MFFGQETDVSSVLGKQFLVTVLSYNHWICTLLQKILILVFYNWNGSELYISAGCKVWSHFCEILY